MPVEQEPPRLEGILEKLFRELPDLRSIDLARITEDGSIVPLLRSLSPPFDGSIRTLFPFPHRAYSTMSRIALILPNSPEKLPADFGQIWAAPLGD